MLKKEWKYYAKISNKDDDDVVLQKLYAKNREEAEKEIEDIIDVILLDQDNKNDKLNNYDWLCCEILKELIVVNK